MEKFSSALSLVSALAPRQPVTCLRPNAAVTASQYFLQNFPGDVLYALKANPRAEILNAVHRAGIRHFDVASISEVRLVAEHFSDSRSDVKMSYMNPVKGREDIRDAYYTYGVRTFSFDSAHELAKIIEVTKGAKDLTLMLRISVPNFHSEIDLSEKFGVDPILSADLLLSARSCAKRLGICFHVGSQCMNPAAFGTAINVVRNTILPSGVMLDVVDVGGGFPSIYPDLTPPPLDIYMSEISMALHALPVSDTCEFWAEPGRALVAESASTLVRVEARKNNQLYINDGTYGSLFDAGIPNFVFPAHAIRVNGDTSQTYIPYSFYGPTCDGMDFMKGPFMLPDDIQEGDYIEIGQTGAYGCTMRTNFNGLYSDKTAILCDAPLMTMYGVDSASYAEQQIEIA